MPSTPRTRTAERPEKRKREKADLGETSQKKKRRDRESGHVVAQAADEEAADGETEAQGAPLAVIDGSENQVDGQGARKFSAPPPWKVVEPMGGRMSNLDPIFSEDGRHLIITYNTSIQVYSTDESLLVRRIPLPVARADPEGGDSNRAYIVASAASRVAPNLLWVASSDGRVWRIDWTTGAGAETFFQTGTKCLLHVAVAAVRIGKVTSDVVFTSEKQKLSSRIVAYDVHAFPETRSRELQTHEGHFSLIKASQDGAVLVGASRNAVLIGALKLGGFKNLGELAFRFTSFETQDDIASLDVRLNRQQRRGAKGQDSAYASPEVDVAVGGARGAVLVYSDVLAPLPGKEGKGGAHPVRSRKYHWHQRAVHAVAWSKDGNYIISGGSETVLVHYQLDTGRLDFLPHLSASIENIVVSPSGASYAVHLDDNSMMVLSTAEMKPTAYMSGVQTLVFSDAVSKDQLVRRVWQGTEDINTPVAAAISPAAPSRLLLSVGNGQQASLSGLVPALPLLQSFDLGAFQNIAKQALARTNATNNAYTAKGFPVTEPTVTRLAFSKDGSWLATVDEWEPPRRDIAPLADGPKFAAEFSRERREIHLKFWRVVEGNDTLDLASKVVGPHFTYRCEDVFGLAADKTSSRFATIGNDGAVRIWLPKLRAQDGHVPAAEADRPRASWVCARTISLGGSLKAQDELLPLDGRTDYERSGAVAFSDDGSLLFVAFGAGSEAVVYIIDTETGDIRSTLHDLCRGPVRDVQVLSSCLVLLSHDLAVYDLVADELRYGIRLDKVTRAAASMTHLAVDPLSRSFAVSVPVLTGSAGRLQKGAQSELAVFTLEDSQPQLMRTIPHLVTSLLATPGKPGFLAIDSAAQIWSAVEGADSAPLAQPLADLKLDATPTESAVVLNGADDEASEDEQEVDAMDVAEDEDEDEDEDDYDIHAAVVAPQRLTDIFDAAPAFAMPPIEDIFYQVAGLFSAKPLTTSSA